MIPQQWQPLLHAVLGGFLIGSGAIGYAQDGSAPGVVRITDSRPKGAPVQAASFGGHHGGTVIDAGSCPTGDCYGDAGNCPYQGHGCFGHGCFGKHGCYGDGCYGYGGCCFGKPCCLGSHCCLREHYGSLSPDHGFSLPAKYPINRRGVQYTSYYPNAWYGTPGGGVRAAYPMVYQPTDTTQLGYYYQHVPFWMPNPNALPARPIPAQWHTYAPAAPAGCYSPGFGFGTPFCPVDDGMTVQGTVVSPTPVPAGPQSSPAAPTIEQGPPPSAPPVEQAPAPSTNDAARRLRILRAAF